MTGEKKIGEKNKMFLVSLAWTLIALISILLIFLFGNFMYFLWEEERESFWIIIMIIIIVVGFWAGTYLLNYYK